MSKRVSVLSCMCLAALSSIECFASEVENKPRLSFAAKVGFQPVADLSNLPFASLSQSRHFDYSPQAKSYPKHFETLMSTPVVLPTNILTPVETGKENQFRASNTATTIPLNKTLLRKPVEGTSKRALNPVMDDELIQENAAFRQEISRLKAENEALKQRWMSSSVDAEEHFMRCFSLLTDHELNAYFSMYLNHVKSTTDYESAVDKLQQLWWSLHSLKDSATTLPTVDKCYKSCLLITAISKEVFAEDALAGMRRVNQELSKTFRSETEQFYAFSIIGQYRDMDIPPTHFLRNSVQLNPHYGRARAIPVLLYLLRVDRDQLISAETFSGPDWQVMQTFIPFLSLPERIAVRYHLTNGNDDVFKSPLSYLEVRINWFLKTLSESIDSQADKKEMEAEDVEKFNKQLLLSFRRALGFADE